MGVDASLQRELTRKISKMMGPSTAMTTTMTKAIAMLMAIATAFVCTIATPLKRQSTTTTTCAAAAISSPVTTTPTPLPNAKLPNPFTFLDGTTPVTSKDEWKCRRAEISTLLQEIELGTKPAAPSNLTATQTSDGLSITCAEGGGKAITFTPRIEYPSSGTAPYPAIIGVGGISIPAPAGVAVIVLDNDDLAAQDGAGSRNVGKFFELYGPTGAGALVGWAWGVSRILDALEQLGDEATRIDVARVGVTGCSRNGKGALVAGALDERIALTIPQESGSGGSACWRLSAAEDVDNDTQTAGEIVDENVWFSTNFTTYAKGAVDALPFDHHMLAGLVAPRGFLSIDNTAYQWLGPMSDYGCMAVARHIWTALGATDHFGESEIGGHSHCAFPSSQQADLDAFVDKFLRGRQDAETDILRTDGNFTFTESEWVDWTTPTLA